jgi:alkylated DNA repair dioxygenase AlkB
MIATQIEIPGLHYIPAYLDADEQADLLDTIDQQRWNSEMARRVQHYGYRYDYKKRAVDESMYLGPLPDWLIALAERMKRAGWIDGMPDQVIINEYEPGQGIASHVDCIPCFGDTIISLSLGSPCVMIFSSLITAAQSQIFLEPGGLIVMQGEARHRWRHGIPARKTDLCDGQVSKRGRRVSVTFRQVVLHD